MRKVKKFIGIAALTIGLFATTSNFTFAASSERLENDTPRVGVSAAVYGENKVRKILHSQWKEEKKTQQQIADENGVSQSTVSRFLSKGINSQKLVDNFNYKVQKTSVVRNENYDPLPESTNGNFISTLPLTPRRTTISQSTETSLDYVKNQFPYFLGWHGTSRHDLTSLRKGLSFPDPGKYVERNHPYLQYGPGFYCTPDVKIAKKFAQERVDKLDPNISDRTPLVVPVFSIKDTPPLTTYDAGDDVDLDILKKSANRPTANGAVNRAVNGKVLNVSPPDIITGVIINLEPSIQHMVTRLGAKKIKIGTAHPTTF